MVLFGCGAAAIAGTNPLADGGPSGIGLLGIAFAFGIAVLVMAYAIGGISGCHINPAISIGLFFAGKLDAKDLGTYILAQILGGILGIAVLYFILNGKADFTAGEWAYGSNGWGEGYLGNYNMTSAFVGEFVFTFLFVFVILAAISKWGNSTMAGLAIGFCLVLIHLVMIPVTGTSVNPARSLAPAIFAGGKALSQVWLFIVAPILGGIFAAIVWKLLFNEKEA